MLPPQATWATDAPRPRWLSLLQRRTVLLAAAACIAPSRAQDGGDAFTGYAGTRVRFASADKARELLMADDEWLAATSEFQRRAVMLSASAVTLQAFRRWNGDAARPWTADQRARWHHALSGLAPVLSALRVPLPPEVWLIASNGQESAQTPYTRGAAVVLPGPASMPGYSDAMLLAHELWHVASRHAPTLATRLYAEIGFEPMPELAYPAAWAPSRIANPDAPANRHGLRLRVGDHKPWVMPVLVASRTTLQAGETFFSVTEPRLLEVEPDASGARSHAVLRGNEPVWHRLDGRHDYLRQLGGNTGYVIHPEETMADNVALLATGAQVRNAVLLARIRAALEAQRWAAASATRLV
jgi:hypothetical protein